MRKEDIKRQRVTVRVTEGEYRLLEDMAKGANLCSVQGVSRKGSVQGVSRKGSTKGVPRKGSTKGVPRKGSTKESISGHRDGGGCGTVARSMRVLALVGEAFLMGLQYGMDADRLGESVCGAALRAITKSSGADPLSDAVGDMMADEVRDMFRECEEEGEERSWRGDINERK